MEVVKPSLENKNIEIIIQGETSKTKSTLHLETILKNTSTEYLHISDKPGPNGKQINSN